MDSSSSRTPSRSRCVVQQSMGRFNGGPGCSLARSLARAHKKRLSPGSGASINRVISLCVGTIGPSRHNSLAGTSGSTSSTSSSDE